MTMPRSMEELIASADQMADQFENYDPQPGDADQPLSPVMAVKVAAFRRATAERELAQAVAAARAEGIGWRTLGESLGTTGEAARQKYATLAS
jgi:hypothetical protein